MSSVSSGAAHGGTVRIARPRKAMIGTYKILGKPLGRGGSATVYRVSGPDGRLFAVKELAPQFLGDKDAVARFRREFEITQELDHQGIVRTYELLEANGTLNIRMELVNGTSLRTLLARHKRLPPRQACRIALEVARTLAFAHSRDVIHRDVKPDNIMVDSEGHVLLGDFGTARLVNLALTRAGTLLGTPVYMAPELMTGKKDALATAASDVYSLGAVLYEAIEGRSPFVSGRRGELLPLLYAKSFQKLRPLAKTEDPELVRLIESCLAREPAARPADMERLSALLRAHATAGTSELQNLVASAAEKSRAAKGRGRASPAEDSRPRPNAPRPAPPWLSLRDARFAVALFATVATIVALLLSLAPGAGNGVDRSNDSDKVVYEVPYRR